MHIDTHTLKPNNENHKDCIPSEFLVTSDLELGFPTSHVAIVSPGNKIGSQEPEESNSYENQES